MKTKGIFRLLATPILALLRYVESVPYSHDGVGATADGGRQAFYAVSAGRQHNVKRRNPL